MVKVFVYGTLRTGDSRYGVDTFVKMVAPEAYINGFDMLDLGGFPGLVANEDKLSQTVDYETAIRGEVHEYENLRVLDRIEGFDEAQPQQGLYNRVQIPAFTKDGEVFDDCWVYIFNADRAHGLEEPIIECGDWFEHRGLYAKLAKAGYEV
jgi:gamma-glutamylcyclotransferase (GGCT)/AIG2-like uncharacterized protein YtfP